MTDAAKRETQRGTKSRWWKRVLFGAMALVALLWALDALVPWPIEGYWWGPGSVTADLGEYEWSNFLLFKSGKAYFGKWPSPGTQVGTYGKQPGGNYSWSMDKSWWVPPFTVTVGLFRVTVSNVNMTARACRVPECWLWLTSRFRNMLP